VTSNQKFNERIARHNIVEVATNPDGHCFFSVVCHWFGIDPSHHPEARELIADAPVVENIHEIEGTN
jgi:hypothetical protein